MQIKDKQKTWHLSECGWFHHTATGNPVIQLCKLFTKFYNLGNLFHKVAVNSSNKYFHFVIIAQDINKISPRYPWDIPKIYWRYAQDNPKGPRQPHKVPKINISWQKLPTQIKTVHTICLLIISLISWYLIALWGSCNGEMEIGIWEKSWPF